MSNKLTWTNETRKLGDLVPWALNPRQIYSEEARRLKGSYEKFAQPWPVIIGPNGELYDGHQRFKVWGEAFGYDLEVAVRVASRPLTEEERQELVILAHKGTVAQWDWDMLADWGVEEKLLDWGFSEEELGMIDFTVPEPKEQQLPTLETEHRIEILCTGDALQQMDATLTEWGRWDGVTVNIS